MTTINRVCLLGYGEVGQVLGEDLVSQGVEVTAFDVLFARDASIPSRALRAQQDVKAAASAQAGAAQADLIVSAVTAAEDVAAARSVGALAHAPYFLDLNSVAPVTKCEAARVIESAGGRYVEAAVMSPIAPRRIASPMLLGGPHTSAFLDAAQALGFAGAQHYGSEIGDASATKMCRSVIIKGLEALLVESLVTARHYGVEEAVLASLRDLLPGADWPRLAHYMISRAVQHGGRRAEEMREAVRAVQAAGLDPAMSTACVRVQDWASAFPDALAHDTLDPLLDRLLEGVQPPPEGKPRC